MCFSLPYAVRRSMVVGTSQYRGGLVMPMLHCPHLTKVALSVGLVLMLLTGTALGQQQEMAPGRSAYVVKEGPIFGFNSLEAASKFVTKAERLSNKGLLRELEKLRRGGKIIDFKVDDVVDAIRMDEKSGLVLVTKPLSPGVWWISGQFIEKYDKPEIEKSAQQLTRFDPVAEAAGTHRQREAQESQARSVEELAEEPGMNLRRLIDESVQTHKQNRTALVKAVEDGDLKMVKSLIAKGANVNARDEDGNTALIYAAGEGHLEIVKLLLDKGADVNAKSVDGMTALTRAHGVRKGDHWREVVKLLIDKGADVDTKREEGLPELISAVSRNDMEMVKLLLDKGADVNAKTTNGYTALNSAVWADPPRPELVRLLIEKGADVNARNSDGDAALMQAVTCPANYVSIEVVKLLLDSGADINAKATDDGSAALMTAVACLRGGLPVEVVKLLLDRGADVNAKD